MLFVFFKLLLHHYEEFSLLAEPKLYYIQMPEKHKSTDGRFHFTISRKIQFSAEKREFRKSEAGLKYFSGNYLQ